MAHLRQRALIEDLKRQLRFWPIVTLLGPRQSGKSTFLRELAFASAHSSYISMDRISARQSAQRNPEQFLSQFEVEPVIIDEAHKAPSLFDEIKAEVDEDRRPGRFILTGSVRFSGKLGIRESFTGRSADLRFDSMVLEETISEEIHLKQIQRYLKMGGMPAVCFLRDQAQIERYWTQWLETSCQRDLMELGKGRLDPDLAYQTLETLCQQEFPSAAQIAKVLKVDARRIKTHLEALEELFMIRKWEPDSRSVGKTLYLPFDCGVASHFRAAPRRQWQTWIGHQVTNLARASGKRDPHLSYNLTARGSFADFSFDRDVLLYCDAPYPTPHFEKTIVALQVRLPQKKIVVCSMTDQPAQKLSATAISRPWKDLIHFQPWQARSFKP